jgi:transcriptional regulator of arginine metabolism
VARLLDLKKDEGVLGTVAGDDTVFIAPTTIKQISSIYQKIYQLLLS